VSNVPEGVWIFAAISQVGYVGASVVMRQHPLFQDSFLAGASGLIGTHVYKNGEFEYIHPIQWFLTVPLLHLLEGIGLLERQNTA